MKLKEVEIKQEKRGEISKKWLWTYKLKKQTQCCFGGNTFLFSWLFDDQSLQQLRRYLLPFAGKLSSRNFRLALLSWQIFDVFQASTPDCHSYGVDHMIRYMWWISGDAVKFIWPLRVCHSYEASRSIFVDLYAHPACSVLNLNFLSFQRRSAVGSLQDWWPDMERFTNRRVWLSLWNALRVRRACNVWAANARLSVILSMTWYDAAKFVQNSLHLQANRTAK